MSKKLMSIILALVVIVGMMPMAAMAEVGGDVTKSILVFEDMPQDWSTEALENAIENGLLNGSNGKILPNDNLTRAEMAAIINRSFKSHKEASLEEFKDVLPEAWYYKEMAKAVQMKTFQGNKGLLNPDAPITREEAFAVISRAFKVENTKKSPKGYSDLSDISVWAREEVYGLINAGYVQGSNGMIKPKETITRAEFAQLMYNLVKEYLNEPGEYKTVDKGNVMINVPSVTLKDVTVDGDLIIGDGVGTGDVILDNVIINGRMVVRGGGKNSIIIKGASKIGKVLVARVDGAVRIKTEEDAFVDTVVVDDGKDKVILEGSINIVEVQTSEVPVVLEKAKVEKISVLAPKTDIKVEKDSEVKAVIVEAEEASIKGTGKVKSVEIKEGANNSAVETPNTEVVVEKGVTGTTGTGGAKIKEDTTIKNNSDVNKPPVTAAPAPTTPASGGGGGGGGGSTPTPTPSKTPEEKLAEIVKGKYSEVTIPNDAADISFDKTKREFTITINKEDEDIVALAGTRAMTALFEIDEITGYDNREFGDENKTTIKGWILYDALGKLGEPTTLGGLKDKELIVGVKASIDGKSFTDNYKFIFK